MDQKIIQSILEKLPNRSLNDEDFQFPHAHLPIAVSARHCHLSKEDLEKLFGSGYELTIKAGLSQPGQYASNETLTIIGPKGIIEKVRILGPPRNLTQVEVSKTDSIKLGLNPPLRQSGNIDQSSSITLLGPKGCIYLEEGLIIAQAHIHMTPENAIEFNVRDKEIVQISAESERPVVFKEVLVRVSPKYLLEMHIDTDEANAALISKGQMGKLSKYDNKNDVL